MPRMYYWIRKISNQGVREARMKSRKSIGDGSRAPIRVFRCRGVRRHSAFGIGWWPLQRRSPVRGICVQGR